MTAPSASLVRISAIPKTATPRATALDFDLERSLLPEASPCGTRHADVDPALSAPHARAISSRCPATA